MLITSAPLSIAYWIASTSCPRERSKRSAMMRQAAHTPAMPIVVATLRSDDPGHVGAVRSDERGPRRRVRVVRTEVPPVDVVDVPVAVVVDVGESGLLDGVDPHRVHEVRMVDVHSGVEDRDDDVVTGRGRVPRLRRVDVGVGDAVEVVLPHVPRLGHRVGLPDVVRPPLLAEVLVVRDHRGHGHSVGFGGEHPRVGLVAADRVGRADALGQFDDVDARGASLVGHARARVGVDPSPRGGRRPGAERHDETARLHESGRALPGELRTGRRRDARGNQRHCHHSDETEREQRSGEPRGHPHGSDGSTTAQQCSSGTRGRQPVTR